MHLEADCPRTGLTFALPGSVLAQIGKILFANAFEREVLVQFFGATGVDMDLQVHLGFAMQAFEIALKLTLVGADRLTESFIILKNSTEAERKNCGMLEAISDNSGMIYAGFLI